MLEILAEITEIPFPIFWGKFLERGGLNLYESRAGAVWFSMTEAKRIEAFELICRTENINDLGHEFLKKI